MNQINFAPRTSARLAEAAIVLSSEEVDILIEALRWMNSGPDEAYALRDRLVTVRDSGIYGGATS